MPLGDRFLSFYLSTFLSFFLIHERAHMHTHNNTQAYERTRSHIHDQAHAFTHTRSSSYIYTRTNMFAPADAYTVTRVRGCEVWIDHLSSAHLGRRRSQSPLRWRDIWTDQSLGAGLSMPMEKYRALNEDLRRSPRLRLLVFSLWSCV